MTRGRSASVVEADDAVGAGRDGLGPAGLEHLADVVGAGVDAGDRVVAVGVGASSRAARSASTDAVVVVDVDVDRPAGEAGLARVRRRRRRPGRRTSCPVLVAGWKLPKSLPVSVWPEVRVTAWPRRQVAPAASASPERESGSSRPGRYLADDVVAGVERERVVAVGVGGRRSTARRLARGHRDAVVVVVVGVDRPAREAGLAARRVVAVGVEVVELRAGLGGLLEVAEVVAGVGLAGGEGDA